MDKNIVALIIILGGGIFCILAAIFNWNWFFENRKAYVFTKLFGRIGARVFYAILGVALIVLGFKI